MESLATETRVIFVIRSRLIPDSRRGICQAVTLAPARRTREDRTFGESLNEEVCVWQSPFLALREVCRFRRR